MRMNSHEECCTTCSHCGHTICSEDGEIDYTIGEALCLNCFGALKDNIIKESENQHMQSERMNTVLAKLIEMIGQRVAEGIESRTFIITHHGFERAQRLLRTIQFSSIPLSEKVLLLGEVDMLLKALAQDETNAQCFAMNEASEAIRLMKKRDE